MLLLPTPPSPASRSKWSQYACISSNRKSVVCRCVRPGVTHGSSLSNPSGCPSTGRGPGIVQSSHQSVTSSSLVTQARPRALCNRRAIARVDRSCSQPTGASSARPYEPASRPQGPPSPPARHSQRPRPRTTSLSCELGTEIALRRSNDAQPMRRRDSARCHTYRLRRA